MTAGQHKEPSALVTRLFLTPDNFFRLGVAIQYVLDVRSRKRVKLFDANDRGVLDIFLALFLKQVVIDLTRAEHEPLYPGRLGLVDVIDEDLKTAARKVCHVRDAKTMTQKTLRAHHDQRLAERA